MNWEDERYIRVYTRDTAEWLSLSADAQSLWLLLMRKFDRSGIIHLGKLGARAVAVVIGHPHLWESRYRAALDELLADGCVTIRDDSSRGGTVLFAPNFTPAQEAVASDRLRAKEYRDRRRAEVIAASPVTIRDGLVTNRDASVTENHARHDSSLRTQAVLKPCRTDLNHATAVACVGSGEVAPPKGPQEADVSPKTMALALVEPAASDWRDEAIDAAYSRYPRKRERGAGAKRFRSQLTTRADGQALLQAVQNYATTVVGRDPDKIKLWPTFASCWRDYVDMEPEPLRASSKPTTEQLLKLADHFEQEGSGDLDS